MNQEGCSILHMKAECLPGYEQKEAMHKKCPYDDIFPHSTGQNLSYRNDASSRNEGRGNEITDGEKEACRSTT
jgi:hypothetical protein